MMKIRYAALSGKIHYEVSDDLGIFITETKAFAPIVVEIINQFVGCIADELTAIKIEDKLQQSLLAIYGYREKVRFEIHI